MAFVFGRFRCGVSEIGKCVYSNSFLYCCRRIYWDRLFGAPAGSAGFGFGAVSALGLAILLLAKFRSLGLRDVERTDGGDLEAGPLGHGETQAPRQRVCRKPAGMI